jgi:phage tail-like protein
VDGEKLQARVPRSLGEQAEIRIEGFSLSFRRIALEAVESEPAQVPQAASKDKLPAPFEIGPPEMMEELPTQLEYAPPPGLSLHSKRLLPFLPDIYHTDFVSRFLGLFESILIPVEWNIENFDLFLTPGAAPPEFLLWLSRWFDLKVDWSWDESRQRAMLTEAHQLYARRGTPWALKRVLQIYLQEEPEIVDQAEDLGPFTFKVVLPPKAREANQDALKRIIEEFKPAYTNYSLEFTS